MDVPADLVSYWKCFLDWCQEMLEVSIDLDTKNGISLDALGALT